MWGRAFFFEIQKWLVVALAARPRNQNAICQVDDELAYFLLQVVGWPATYEFPGWCWARNNKEQAQQQQTENKGTITNCRPHLLRTRTIYTNKNNKKYKPTRTTTKNLVVNICYGSSIFGYWNCSLLSSCYVFSIIVLVRCVFVLFIVIDLVLCCCCCCSLCLFFVLIIVVARSLCSLSLILSRRLLVASFWTPRKTSPSVRWNNHFLMLLVILFVHCSWTWSLNSSVLLVLGSFSLLLFSSFVRWLCSWSCYCPCCWCSVVCSWSVLYDWFLVWGLFLVLDVFSKYNETQRTRISWFWFLFSLISFFYNFNDQRKTKNTDK